MKAKWAVENVNPNGARARYMETHQLWVAEHLRDKANATFERLGSSARSEVVKLTAVGAERGQR